MNLAFRKLWQTFRSGQPEFVKRAGRAAFVMFARPAASPQIDAQLLESCRVVPNRTHLVSLLPKSGIIGEVGVETGSFSEFILKTSAPQALHLFDIDFGKTSRAVLADHRVVQHCGLSAELLARMPDNFFDWLYIDGDHKYAGVKADCMAGSRKVKPGGYLVFNDFLIIDTGFGRYGVHQAVSEFIMDQRWPVQFFALAANGHYDIAIQRPMS